MQSIFDHLLASLNVRVDAFGYCEIHEGWSLAFPGGPTAHVHYCLAGEGSFADDSGTTFQLQPDSVVLIPEGIRGEFRSPNPVRVLDCGRVPLEDPPQLNHIRAGSGSDAPLIIACGTVSLDSAGCRILLSLLGEAVVSAAVDPPFGRDLINQLLAELDTPRPGARPIVDTLLRLCLLLLLRKQHEEGRYPEWVVGSAPNSLLEQVIVNLIEAPGANFSVEQLARTAGMSRSAFVRAFSATVGQPPGAFVRDLRLGQAARLLATTRRPVTRVATDVGYESRSYFSRLFRAKYGVDPSGYRHVS